jgi:hypothetical protein
VSYEENGMSFVDVAIIIGFCGCGYNEKEKAGTIKILCFYNQKGKVVMEPEDRTCR